MKEESVMSFTKLAVRFAAPVPNPDSFQRYLFLGPHPDDIEIGAGASIAALAAKGKDICFLIVTDGRYGDSQAPEGVRGDDLAALRKEESLKSAAALGVTDVRFLGLSDGGFYTEEELLRGIAGVIADFQPDILFAPDPFVSSECHTDHLNTGRAARTLAVNAGNRGIMEKLGASPVPVKAIAFYMTAKPNRYIDTSGFFETQLDSVFKNHLSQYPEGSEDAASIQLYLKLRAYEFGIRTFHKTAEGFRVLGSLHMHCLPEAGN